MLIVMSGANAIAGSVERNGLKAAHEADDCDAGFHASNEAENDGRPILEPIVLKLKTGFAFDKFLKSLLIRKQIGEVKIVRHVTVDGQVVRESEVTLTNAIIKSFHPTISQGAMEANVVFTYDKIKLEMFDKGRQTGSVSYDRIINRVD